MKSSSLPTTDLALELQEEMDKHWVVYNDSGSSLHDVPARDLSRKEFESFVEDKQADILACGLYNMRKIPQKKDAPATESAKE